MSKHKGRSSTAELSPAPPPTRGLVSRQKSLHRCTDERRAWLSCAWTTKCRRESSCHGKHRDTNCSFDPSTPASCFRAQGGEKQDPANARNTSPLAGSRYQMPLVYHASLQRRLTPGVSWNESRNSGGRGPDDLRLPLMQSRGRALLLSSPPPESMSRESRNPMTAEGRRVSCCRGLSAAARPQVYRRKT